MADSENRKNDAPEYPEFTCRICDVTHFDLPYVRIKSEGKKHWAVCLPCASKCAQQRDIFMMMMENENP